MYPRFAFLVETRSAPLVPGLYKLNRPRAFYEVSKSVLHFQMTAYAAWRFHLSSKMLEDQTVQLHFPSQPESI